MAVFLFEAKDPRGHLVKGEVEANSDVEVRVRLRAQQFTPLKVSPKSKSPLNSLQTFFQAGVSAKELQIFTRQFSTLINSGIPIVQGLDILKQGTKNPQFKNAIERVKQEISTGVRLGEALDHFPKIFDRLYVNLVKAGEEGGVLDVILNRLATYIEKSAKIKNKIKGALWYPAGILIVATVVIWVILSFVIPSFEKLFKDSGKELPDLTQLVIGMSHFVQHYWYMIIATIITAVVSLKKYYASEEGRMKIDRIAISAPVIGGVIQKAAVARFSRTMSTLLSSGVGILEAMEISSKVVGNSVIEKAIIRSRDSIAQGRSMIEPLSQEKMIPDMLVQMVGVGEQTGALDTMLAKVADFYEDEVDYAVAAMASLMEPALMVFLGGIVAFLVIAMYLPLFQLAGTQG